jgi:hypothetical protein
MFALQKWTFNLSKRGIPFSGQINSQYFFSFSAVRFGALAFLLATSIGSSQRP